jgi:hypothetical protein
MMMSCHTCHFAGLDSAAPHLPEFEALLYGVLQQFASEKWCFYV